MPRRNREDGRVSIPKLNITTKPSSDIDDLLSENRKRPIYLRLRFTDDIKVPDPLEVLQRKN